MDSKEIRGKTREILATFVDSIGLDGEWYSKINQTPFVWGYPLNGSLGEFVSPNSRRLERFIARRKMTNQQKEVLQERGMIVLQKEYKEREMDEDFFVTLIHEILHANRNLLLHDVSRQGKNERAYVYNNGRFEQNTDEFLDLDVDVSQDILKGNIDTSRTVVDSYASKTNEEIEDIGWDEGNIDDKMEKQLIIDEALVELIAAVSYKLYSAKQQGQELDVWGAIEEAGEKLDPDIRVMCQIILNHHDFELFNWMLDPLSYSQGDIHYDFFEHYTIGDEELVEELYTEGRKILESGRGVENDDAEDFTVADVEKESKQLEITAADVKAVATTASAIQELINLSKDLKSVQNQKQDRDDNKEK